MSKFIGILKYIIFAPIIIFILLLSSLYVRIFTNQKLKKIIFGTTPIINNKYWSMALREIGIETETLMKTYYSSINKKDDYDKYFDDLIPDIFKNKHCKSMASIFFVWLYIINNAKIFIMPFHGVILNKYFWKFEYLLFKINGIKTIVLPYGADAYMYSRIRDISLQNVLLISYPNAAKEEKLIEKKVFFWSKYADFVMCGLMSGDGMPRWDLTILKTIQIDTKQWRAKKTYSNNDGKNGIVKIVHTPNHRGFKGTEYLIEAVERIKNEGLLVELILLEKVQNEEVKRIMQEVDILAEQFIATGYALSGIEGMASGLPVLANLEDDNYLKFFRRYSFLNECPILSTSPETLKENLRLLITKPELRKKLGLLGVKYVEKYHSYSMAQHMFTNIFKKLGGEDIDLMNLYHPLKSEYVKSNYIQTGLTNNKYINEG